MKSISKPRVQIIKKGFLFWNRKHNIDLIHRAVFSKLQITLLQLFKIIEVTLINLLGIPLQSTLVGRLRHQNSFIIYISGVLLLLENHFLYLKILPRNLWIDLCIHIQRLISNIKHQIIKYHEKELLMQFKKKRSSDLLHRLQGPYIMRRRKNGPKPHFSLGNSEQLVCS